MRYLSFKVLLISAILLANINNLFAHNSSGILFSPAEFDETEEIEDTVQNDTILNSTEDKVQADNTNPYENTIFDDDSTSDKLY